MFDIDVQLAASLGGGKDNLNTQLLPFCIYFKNVLGDDKERSNNDVKGDHDLGWK